jgi:Histidine kinase-, DNA gyrase B-, and HSP90-like ATPase
VTERAARPLAWSIWAVSVAALITVLYEVTGHRVKGFADQPGSTAPFVGVMLFILTGATRAQVCVSAEGEELAFEVTDDGAGFDQESNGYGTGLQGMADRLAALGGGLDVISAPGAGTTVRGRVPAAVDASIPRPAG